MRNPGGYAIAVDPGGGNKLECDTFTCGHCNSIHFVAPKQDAADLGGLCKVCMSLICGPCVDNGRCTPFERRLELHESVNRFRQVIDDVNDARLWE